MKQKLALALSLALLLTLCAACGGGTPAESADPSTPATGQVTASPAASDDPAPATGTLGEKTAAFAALMQGDYYMEYSAYVMGMEMEGASASKDGDVAATTTVMGMSMRTLTKDGKQYQIDDASKKYEEVESTSPESPSSGAMDYSGMVYKGKGNGAVPGLEDVDTKLYDYEEYAISGGTEDIDLEVTVRMYMKGDSLYAITSGVMGITVTMVIKTLSDEIPAGFMDLPADYEKVDSLVDALYGAE